MPSGSAAVEEGAATAGTEMQRDTTQIYPTSIHARARVTVPKSLGCAFSSSFSRGLISSAGRLPHSSSCARGPSGTAGRCSHGRSSRQASADPFAPRRQPNHAPACDAHPGSRPWAHHLRFTCSSAKPLPLPHSTSCSQNPTLPPPPSTKPLPIRLSSWLHRDRLHHEPLRQWLLRRRPAHDEPPSPAHLRRRRLRRLAAAPRLHVRPRRHGRPRRKRSQETPHCEGTTTARAAWDVADGLQACDMCRKKKIKCDGKMPSCTHCLNYKTECIFTQVEKKRQPPKG